MTTWQILILVAGIAVVDTAVVGALLAAGGVQWKRFAAYFPRRPVLARSQQRTWQSVRLGVWNWGCCFTITVDAECVHLTPGPRIGKLMGDCTASIPVEAFAQVPDVQSKPPSRFSRMKLKLAGQSVELPDWVRADVRPRPLPPAR